MALTWGLAPLRASFLLCYFVAFSASAPVADMLDGLAFKNLQNTCIF